MHGILTVSMSQILYRHSLRRQNSFGIDVRAARYSSPGTLAELEQVLSDPDNGKEILILGEGSNILFTRDYPGTVIRPQIMGIEVLEEDREKVIVRVGAGENWDNWVRTSLEKHWYGLENLSLIPGSVGSSPVQNIGAYGVELKDHFAWLEAWDMLDKKLVRIEKEECAFGYRQSIFKGRARGRYVICHVVFSLLKKPELVLGYGNIDKLFRESSGSGPADLRKVVIAVREAKLPDHEKTGNAGSFFKNPVIEESAYRMLNDRFGEVPSFPAPGKMIKVPAAWIIDKCGWKGRRIGAVGSWPTQPLVIVNYGGATGMEIYDFSQQIIEDVRVKTGISLEREVNVI